jgi:serine/threonine-protein kinase
MSDFLSNFDSNEMEKISDNVVEGKQRRVLQNKKYENEETELDPQYHKKKKRQKRILILLTIVLLAVSGLTYYQVSHVTMPNFKGKSLSDAQKWATQYKIKVSTEDEFNEKIEVNSIIKQSKKEKKKIKKGSSVTFSVSKGANPDDKITLPNFKEMKQSDVEKWIKKEQLESMVVVDEYSEIAPKGSFLREELSEGKEVYQKDISVPDFKGKTQLEIENWAKKNEVELEIKKVSSESIPLGQVVEQSIKEKEKIAKKTKLTVNISAGKGVKVPNFANLTKENAMTQGKLQVTVEERFNLDIPYGELLSQSVEAETELTEEDDLSIKVTYSAGKPYLKDLTGQNEGELQKYFYDEFRSKGANIYYVVNYVNSDAPKGEIVSMDTSNTFLPLEYTVTVNVSLGY